MLKITLKCGRDLSQWEDYIDQFQDILKNKRNKWYFKDMFPLERKGKKLPLYSDFDHVEKDKENYIELNALRIGVDKIIENLHKKGEKDGRKYDDIRLCINTLAISQGYKPYYNIDIKDFSEYNKLIKEKYTIKSLLDFPTCMYIGTQAEKNLTYVVSDLSEVCNYITSRYINNIRISGTYDISPKGKCCGNPGDYAYKGKCENLSETKKRLDENVENTENIENIKNDDKKKRKAKATDPEDLEKVKKAIDGCPELVDPIRENGKFRIENRRVHLTYSYHIDPKEYIEKMGEKLSTYTRKMGKALKIEYYSIAQEVGISKGYDEPHPHTHVALSMSNPIISTDPRCFDYSCEVNPPEKEEWCHPNIRVVSNKKHWEYLCSTYHKKEVDPYTNYITDVLIQPINMKSINECKDFTEVQEMIDKRNPDKCHLAFVYDAIRDKNKKIENEKEQEKIKKGKKIPLLRSWQTVVDEIIKYVNRRTIIAIVGLGGNEGKSIVIDHLCANYNGISIPPMKAGDIAHLIMSTIKNSGVYPSLICLDAPRCYENSTTDSIFALFENIKNGRLASGKYESSSTEFVEPPTIVIFANDFPDISKLSLDRWMIGKINQNSFEHMFLGTTAKALLYQQMEDQKILKENYNEKGIEYINKLKSLEKCMFWPVETLIEGKSYINVIDMLYEDNYIAEITCTKRPITKIERELNKTESITLYGILHNNDLLKGDEDKGVRAKYKYRELYPSELRDGIYKIDMKIRKMTEEEIIDKNYNRTNEKKKYEAELEVLVEETSKKYIRNKLLEIEQ